MLRRVIAGLVLVGMAIGIWLLWPRSEDPTTPLTTVPMASEPSTTGTSSVATTAVDTTTSTTLTDDHVVENVDEAEAILRELWFGWFEGIYNQDEDRIREVVATEEQVQAASRAMETVSFVNAPRREGIVTQRVELLRSDEACIAIWSESDSSFLESGPTRTGVDVIRWTEGSWKLLSAWAHRNDLWEADCESLLP